MIVGIRGRLEGRDTCSSSHVVSSSFHNWFENPEGGLSGRRPFMTKYITAASFVL